MDAKQVPLRELLASVPADARLLIDDADGKGSRSIPVGRLCQEAAAALADGDKLSPGEPVAWRWGYRSITTGEMDWRGYVEIPSHPNLRSPAIIMEPLYTAPPQRKPLTDEKVCALWSWSMTAEAERTATTQQHAFARAIERAHGIGDNT